MIATQSREGPKMSDPTETTGRPWRSRAAKIAGIVGAVICVLLIVAVWFGYFSVSGANPARS